MSELVKCDTCSSECPLWCPHARPHCRRTWGLTILSHQTTQTTRRGSCSDKRRCDLECGRKPMIVRCVPLTNPESAV